MKLAFQGSLRIGGLGTFTSELTRHLAKLVDEIRVFDAFGSNIFDGSPFGHLDQVLLRGSRKGPVPHPLSLLSQFAGLPRMMREFDLVHVNYAFLGLPAVIAKKLHSVPYLYTIHGVPQPWLEPFGRAKMGYLMEETFLPMAAGNADMVVAVSEYVQRILKERYRIGSAVIYHGVDAERFRPGGQVEKARLRRLFGLDGKELLVLTVGRLHQYKDPLTLVRSTPLVLEELPHTKFVLVGKGEMYSDVIRETERLGVKNAVIVKEDVSREDICRWYAVSDLFVLPSINEMFGLVLLEAMSSGLPTIAADRGACSEVLGEAGVFFNGGDHVELAGKIVELLTNPSLSEELGSRGRTRVLEKFNWHTAARNYADLYKELLHG